jgi:hypothetical protein
MKIAEYNTLLKLPGFHAAVVTQVVNVTSNVFRLSTAANY